MLKRKRADSGLLSAAGRSQEVDASQEASEEPRASPPRRDISVRLASHRREDIPEYVVNNPVEFGRSTCWRCASEYKTFPDLKCWIHESSVKCGDCFKKGKSSAHGVVANESPANVATLAAAQKAFASRSSVVRKELADKSKALKENPWPTVLEALDKLGERIVNELQANNQQLTRCLQTSTEQIIAAINQAKEDGKQPKGKNSRDNASA
ncbi:hypothetical protein BP5796_12454 [Coleophoma crateriformis]|uniref:Uncharacterized protein n=1 Tax=Coleophoma crateriformis TaxID=565419 RepID=A0A3D8Q760_9HELO|nr:hypothetical protein BP5796_12454 [Coleophoma crateriformis]